ncbi:nucleotidyltransferase family protein [bacterium]|nr:nucleotidyltransferase family protein [bacterium]MBU1984508.1 nucleotidyltransferase family protein [bacterium]
MNPAPRIPLDYEKIKAFCEKWKITEFSLFGSVLTDDFRPDSDVDVLVEFAEDARWGLFDMVHMEDELKEVFGRDVDLLTRRSVEANENYIVRKNILRSTRRVYAAR